VADPRAPGPRVPDPRVPDPRVPDPRGIVAPLVDELRAVGVPVSVGEHLDAARAVAHLPLRSSAVLRAALRCTLVKEASQLGLIRLLFDLWIAGAADADSEAADSADTGTGPLAGLSDAALRAALRDAISAGDSFLQPLLADEYVRRFSGAEPGRAVAGVRYLLAATQAAGLDGIRDGLLADSLSGGDGLKRGRRPQRGRRGRRRAGRPGRGGNAGRGERAARRRGSGGVRAA